MEWMEEQHQREKAAKTADELIARLKMRPPIDPLAVARTESPLLRAGGCDLGNRYDGKLEYIRSKRLFLLYYNTKYDAGLLDGEHHPRTRFSISHELGHFFIEHHHQSLRNGAKPHRSINEFRSQLQIEREADAFAASLMMPSAFARPMVNQSQLSMHRIDQISKHFGASIVSAAIRSVRLSDFPCALAGIRGGEVAWVFASDALVEAGFYPKRDALPENAVAAWNDMADGVFNRTDADGSAADWFHTYNRENLRDVYVCEEYHPTPITDTLLALLAVDESDLGKDEGEDADDD
jgi:hypothetical protein